MDISNRKSKMKNNWIVLIVLLASGMVFAAPTRDYFELGYQDSFQINDGSNYQYSSYYGFSQSKTGEETYDRLFGNRPSWVSYVGDSRPDTGYQYAHNPQDLFYADSWQELAWVMENVDMTGTVIYDQSNLSTPTSNYGFVIQNSIALSMAAIQMSNLTDVRSGNGYATLLIPVGLDVWELRDSQQYGYTLYEYHGEGGQTIISDPSGLHSVVSYVPDIPDVQTIPAPSSLLLASLAMPMLGWLRRRKTI